MSNKNGPNGWKSVKCQSDFIFGLDFNRTGFAGAGATRHVFRVQISRRLPLQGAAQTEKEISHREYTFIVI